MLVCLDSNHTHEHVLAELEAYAPLTTVGSYCVVFDTVVEDLPADMFPDRPWGPGDNPKTAVREYLRGHPEFEIDPRVDHKLLISVAPERLPAPGALMADAGRRRARLRLHDARPADRSLPAASSSRSASARRRARAS